jgi:hypothetical protein
MWINLGSTSEYVLRKAAGEHFECPFAWKSSMRN